MKQYLLFHGDHYYPCGGWSDFKGDYDTVAEATENVDDGSDDWYEVVDIETGAIIKHG